MSGLLSGLTSLSQWAIAYAILWAALLAIAASDSAAPVANALAWLIAFGVVLDQGIPAMRTLGVIQ